MKRRKSTLQQRLAALESQLGGARVVRLLPKDPEPPPPEPEPDEVEELQAKLDAAEQTAEDLRAEVERLTQALLDAEDRVEQAETECRSCTTAEEDALKKYQELEEQICPEWSAAELHAWLRESAPRVPDLPWCAVSTAYRTDLTKFFEAILPATEH